MKFNELNLLEPILNALTKQGYTEPTPIQQQAIPYVLEGRDVMGCAQTGTGKTAAFAIPIIHNLHRMIGSSKKTKEIRCLVVTPTRELAVQIGESFDTYGKYTNIRQLTIFGGVSQVSQVNTLRRGVDILVATPGRLLDLMQQNYISLRDIKFFVLDEADRMLDMGFIPDIEEIFKRTPFTRQTLFFSATMAPEIERITNTFLSNPAKIEVARAATTNTNIKQGVLMFKGSNKAKEPAEKRAVLRALIDREGDACTNAIIFCNRKTTVRELNTSLQRHGMRSGEIHGDIDQASRQKQLEAFKNGDINLLVASDVAARGLDVKGVSHVFNFDAPWHPDDYVHRIGRTGRAGAKGKAFTFVTKADEEAIENIEKLIGTKIDRLGKVEAPSGEPEERAPAKRGRKPAEPKIKAAPAEAAAPSEPKPAREKAAAKPAREKAAPKAEAEPAQKPSAAPAGDDGWNGPMPGFLGVGFGTS